VAVARLDSNVVVFGHGRQHGRDGPMRGEATAWLGQRRDAVGTALLTGAFMARRGHGAGTWQPRGDGPLTDGPGAESGG
jgi:hypothetical protein